MADRTINAAAFKQRCLALLDRVADSREPITVTKRGRPVARVVPIDAEPERTSLRGSVTFLAAEEDLFSTGDAWDVER